MPLETPKRYTIVLVVCLSTSMRLILVLVSATQQEGFFIAITAHLTHVKVRVRDQSTMVLDSTIVTIPHLIHALGPETSQVLAATAGGDIHTAETPPSATALELAMADQHQEVFFTVLTPHLIHALGLVMGVVAAATLMVFHIAPTHHLFHVMERGMEQNLAKELGSTIALILHLIPVLE